MATIAEQIAAATAHKAAKIVQIRRKYFQTAIQELGTRANTISHG